MKCPAAHFITIAEAVIAAFAQEKAGAKNVPLQRHKATTPRRARRPVARSGAAAKAAR
jgi:hypothetical protein